MKCLLLAALTTGLLLPSSAQAAWWNSSPDCSKKKFSTEELTKRSKPGVVVVLTDKARGSGFVVQHIKNQTLILTNSHVITGAKRVLVQWPDGEEDLASVVLDGGAETTLTDLALLKVQGKEGKVLPLKKDKITVGGEVIALGAPQGLAFSLTKGVISSLRDEGRIIQTDTAINAGSSGGPLINKSGCVVGVNTEGMTKSVGLNFAISSQTAQRFINKYDPDSSSPITSQPNQSVPIKSREREREREIDSSKKRPKIQDSKRYWIEEKSVHQLIVRGMSGRYITFIGRSQFEAYKHFLSEETITKAGRFVYQLDCRDATADRKGDVDNAVEDGWFDVFKDPVAQEAYEKYCPIITELPFLDSQKAR